MSKSQMKTMLITFFNMKGIVHFEFFLQGQTFNQAYYMAMLKQLCEVVHRKGLNFGLMVGISTVM
jgi:hypothetical protein